MKIIGALLGSYIDGLPHEGPFLHIGVIILLEIHNTIVVALQGNYIAEISQEGPFLPTG